MGDTKAQQIALLGAWGNSRRAVTTTYTVALLDKGWTVACGGAASYTVALNAASGYDADFQVVILNEDASQTKTVAPNGLSSFTLLPGHSIVVYNQNNTWRLLDSLLDTLGLGNSGQVLTSNGASANPSWTTTSITFLTNSLGSDVSINSTASYFDGPNVGQGSVGTWFASGTVTLVDTAGAADMDAKLWDGTTVIASGKLNLRVANGAGIVALSGVIASPAGNLRISCRDETSASGLIKFNFSGNSKDSTITALRIA